MTNRYILVAASLACIPTAWAQPGPPGKQLTARELFYAAAQQPAATPAQPAARPAPAKIASRQTHAPEPRQEHVPAMASASPAGPAAAGSQYLQVAYAPRQGTPLGLRYTILKRVDGQMVEVTPDAVFHAGDRIQVSVEANDGGYLYIVSQGSSGAWKPLFPSAEIEGGDNHIEKGRAYIMPPGSRFYFDEQAGVEKLFIVLSRQPEADLEKLIYSLRGGEKTAPAAQPAPPRPARPAVLLASNLQIADSVVGNLRNVYARDLVIEKVDDSAAPAVGRKETAVYVVNPSGSPDARVVADIHLTHQ